MAADTSPLVVRLDLQQLESIEEEDLIKAKRSMLEVLLPECHNCPTLIIDSLDAPGILPLIRIYHFTALEAYLYKESLLHDPQPIEIRLNSVKRVSASNEQRCYIFLWRILHESTAAEHDHIRDQLFHYMNALQKEHLSPQAKLIESTNDEKTAIFLSHVQCSWRNKDANSKLLLANFDGIRGLGVSTDIPGESPVIELPVENIISIRLVTGTLMDTIVNLELSEDTLLTLWLIREFYQEQSPWRYYLDALPMSFDGALYYDEEEISILEATEIGREIRAYRHKHLAIFESVYLPLIQSNPHFFNPKIFCLENYLWAQSVLDSRSIRLNLDGKSHLCLLPLVDMINGDTVSFLQGYNSLSTETYGRNTYTLRSLLPLERNQQLKMCYGPLSNRELLLFYGFSYEANQYDTFSFELEVDDGPIGVLQSNILSRLGLATDHCIQASKDIPKSLFMTVYVLLMSELEMTELLELSEPKMASRIYYSACNSRPLLQNLEGILSGLLEHHNSTMVRVVPSSKRLRVVRTYLESKEAILQQAINKLRQLFQNWPAKEC